MPRHHKPPFKMDPDIYDTLDGMAQYFGGVGHTAWCVYNKDLIPIAPVCGVGFLQFGGAWGAVARVPWVGFDALHWDNAVNRVMRRNPKRITVDQYGVERVPLKLVLKELNIVRGEG